MVLPIIFLVFRYIQLLKIPTKKNIPKPATNPNKGKLILTVPNRTKEFANGRNNAPNEKNPRSPI
jgi:hypothetical protein